MEAGIDEWVEAVVVAARASVSRSPARFRQAYVVSIGDIVSFVTDRPSSLSGSTVLRATATLARPGEGRSVDRGGTPSAP
jgi:hypothetical protein